jgi:hypothetical protein
MVSLEYALQMYQIPVLSGTIIIFRDPKLPLPGNLVATIESLINSGISISS